MGLSLLMASHGTNSEYHYLELFGDRLLLLQLVLDGLDFFGDVFTRWCFVLIAEFGRGEDVGDHQETLQHLWKKSNWLM